MFSASKSVTTAQTVLHSAKKIMRIIEAKGGSALIVGGFVRDLVMGLTPGDLDIATDLDLALLADSFRLHHIGKNKAFNLALITIDGISFELSRFRGPTSYNEQGAAIGLSMPQSFTQDASHRDFTINVMGMDIHGNLLDPFGGQNDIAHRLLRCVGNPQERMQEDPLRALRAVRFAARFNFSIEASTGQEVQNIGPSLAHIAAERIGDELTKMAALPGPIFANAVKLLADYELLRYFLPEIEVLRTLKHNRAHHPEGGVFTHILKALEKHPEAEPVVNLGILFHDVGKALALEWRDGQPTYHGHEKAGAQLITLITDRLKLNRELADSLCFVAEHHMQVHVLDQMRPSKVLRLVHSPYWALLKEVARCDTAAKGNAQADGALSSILHEAEQYVANRGPTPVLSGRRVIELTGLQPGPEIGKLIREVSTWSEDNNVTETARIEQEVIKRAQALYKS